MDTPCFVWSLHSRGRESNREIDGSVGDISNHLIFCCGCCLWGEGWDPRPPVTGLDQEERLKRWKTGLNVREGDLGLRLGITDPRTRVGMWRSGGGRVDS